jgi:hypothetical protein
LREVEAPTFSDIRLINGGKVVSPTCRPLFTLRKIPGDLPACSNELRYRVPPQEKQIKHKNTKSNSGTERRSKVQRFKTLNQLVSTLRVKQPILLQGCNDNEIHGPWSRQYEHVPSLTRHLNTCCHSTKRIPLEICPCVAWQPLSMELPPPSARSVRTQGNITVRYASRPASLALNQQTGSMAKAAYTLGEPSV